MTDDNTMADLFERNRPRMRAVAYRMLGSFAEADDAVQEAWLRLSRTGVGGVDNLAAWLTTVVGRICLDMLRSRASRREEPLDAGPPEPVPGGTGGDPEQEALLADSVGLALLVVLDTLTPVERLAFVLHDMFAISFEEIAAIVGRSPAATRQLASRARRRVRTGEAPEAGEAAGTGEAPGTDAAPGTDVARRREIVDAFLAAARGGEFTALLTMLDPDVVVRADAASARLGGSAQMRGARDVAAFFSGRATTAHTALVDGNVGAVVLWEGDVRIAIRFTIVEGRIAALDAIADPERLRELDVTILDSAARPSPDRRD